MKEIIELKREFTKDIIKEIIAFLNTKGGNIYIGIDDKGDAICIKVKEGSAKPYYIQGKGLRPEGVYVRLGSTSVPSLEAGIKQMLISDQCNHTIKIAVFGEEDELEFLDRREFSGSVFSVLKDTLQYLDLNNHLHSEIVEYQRVEHNDYNKEIIREGLLNSIIHRDYSYNGPILISIYKNRIETTSLGGLVYGISFNDIGAGISQSRNPILANIFYRLKYIEAYGTGIKKIQREYKEFALSKLIQITDKA